MAQHDPEAARQWVQDLFEAVAVFAEFPRRGRMVPELQRTDIREMVWNQHRVIYRLNADTINILTVIHGRQQFDADEVV